MPGTAARSLQPHLPRTRKGRQNSPEKESLGSNWLHRPSGAGGVFADTIADPWLVDARGNLMRVARIDADEDGDVDVKDFDLLVSGGVEEARAIIAYALASINGNPPVVNFTSAGSVTENDPGAVNEDGPILSFGVSDPRFEVQGEALKPVDGGALDRETIPAVTASLYAGFLSPPAPGG